MISWEWRYTKITYHEYEYKILNWACNCYFVMFVGESYNKLGTFSFWLKVKLVKSCKWSNFYTRDLLNLLYIHGFSHILDCSILLSDLDVKNYLWVTGQTNNTLNLVRKDTGALGFTLNLPLRPFGIVTYAPNTQPPSVCKSARTLKSFIKRV